MLLMESLFKASFEQECTTAEVLVSSTGPLIAAGRVFTQSADVAEW